MKLLIRDVTFDGDSCEKAEDLLVTACWEVARGGPSTREDAAFLDRWTVLLREDGLDCHESLADSLVDRNVNWGYKGAWEEGWCHILMWYFRILPDATIDCFRRTLLHPDRRALAFGVLVLSPEYWPDELFEKTSSAWDQCVDEAASLDDEAFEGLANALAVLSTYDERPAQFVQRLKPLLAERSPKVAERAIASIEYAERHSNQEDARRPWRHLDEEEPDGSDF